MTGWTRTKKRIFCAHSFDVPKQRFPVYERETYMKIRPGYKQTEVGVIPEDWEIIPLGRFITDFRGGASLKPVDFKSNGIKVLPKGGVGRSGWLAITENDLQYCSKTYAAAHSSNQVDEQFTIVVLRDLVPSGPSIGLMVE